jgi:hypothetical protein
MITHYTLDTKSTEYMYLPPFRVCNYAGFSNITKLVEDEIPVSPGTYVTEETITISGKQVMPWKHWVYVTKIPALKPEASDKMLERIKVLINFI